MALVVDQFVRDLDAEAERFTGAAERTIRRAGFELMRRNVLATPVDTGRARSGYFAGLNSAPLDVGVAADPTGTDSIARGAEASARFKLGDEFIVRNNVPYIAVLDRGRIFDPALGRETGSLQAPNGWTRRVSAETERVMYEVIAPSEGLEVR